MRLYRIVPLAAGIAILGSACDRTPTVPNLNNPSAEDYTGVLTNDKLQTAVVGVLSQQRTSIGMRWLSFTTTLGRDSWRMDASESRFITETLESTPARGGFVGGGLFADFYVGIRAANNVLAAQTPGLSAGQRSAVRGFVATLKAHDLLRVAETRDTVGMPVAVDDPNVLAPILCKKDALAAISAQLEVAYTELQAAAGAAIPFTLPAGWQTLGGDYRQAANLIKYNRGLAGKVLTYRAIMLNDVALATQAITALDLAIGADTTAAGLARGPYWQYSTASGETIAALFDNKLHLQPHVVDSIQAGDRRRAKIDSVTTPYTQSTSGFQFSTRYDYYASTVSNAANQTRPLSVLRNEELVLLRAQAKVVAGNLLGATQDVNIVRTTVGGLAPRAVFTTATQAIDAILYEKRYSFLMEGPHRWVDLRAYGRLNATYFPPSTATVKNASAPFASDPYTAAFPIPQAEFDARKGNVTKTCS